MTTTGSPSANLPCEQFVQLVTAYLQDALPGDVRARVDEHLAGCLGCRNVLTQWGTIIDLTGQLTEADLENADELTRDRLLSLFRGLRRR
jgi:predicted anti-sigma-YlaC factor YlaD